jgi:hypothetical protein
MTKYPTSRQMMVCDLTLFKRLSDREAARRMKKSKAAVKQLRYRLRKRSEKDPMLAAFIGMHRNPELKSKIANLKCEI